MTSSAYELDGQVYVWTGSRWYRQRDFVTPPGVVIHQLDQLRGDQPAEDEEPVGHDERPTDEAAAEELIERARKTIGSGESPRSIERPLMKCRASELRELHIQRYNDPDGLQEILIELLFRSMPGALELRETVAVRLVELSEMSFLWPSTEAPGGDATLDASNWPRVGPLKVLGYHVGQNGAHATARHEILDLAYSGRLPNVNSAEYMASWGEPGSAARLHRMADSLASNCRNRKRRDSGAVAVHEWEADLEYLRKRYYEGRYFFEWPDTLLA